MNGIEGNEKDKEEDKEDKEEDKEEEEEYEHEGGGEEDIVEYRME